MALSFAFSPDKGETPQTIAQRRQMSNLIAARMLGTAPKNVGEGLNAIGQALIARSMMGDADAAQKAGEASLPDFLKAQITGQPAAPSVATPPAVAAAPMGGASIPSGEIDPRLKDAINNVASTRDVDPAYMTRLALVENGGKIEGGSPLSSAQGPFQFLKGTAQQYGLANPNDPTASADAAARFTMDNRAALTKALGREPTPGELYLAHQQGAGGAIKLLQNPDAPVESVIGAAAARNNAAAPGMTAGQFANKWTGKFGDIVQTVDPNQKNIIDAQADMPVAAPTAVAGAAPAPVADDSGTTLPPNAQPTGGVLPTAQAVQAATQPQNRFLFKNASDEDLQKALLNPFTPENVRTALTQEAKMRADAAQKASDPMRALDMQTKQLAIRKAQQELDNPDKLKIVKIGQDSLGREQYGIFNPSDGSVKPYTPPNNGQPDPLGNTNLTGKDYLATLPKEQANTVQLMVEGKIPPPTSFAMSKPYWQNMISAAKNYDPTFDATAWAGRVAGTRDFSSGKSAEMVRSANQTLHHVGQLLDSMDKLNNGSYPMINSVGNYIAEARGSGAQGAFRTNAHAVAEELSKVFKGSNLSDAEIKSWEQNLHENMSPEQQRMQIAKLRDLLQGSLHALDEKRTASIGPMAAEKAGPIIKDEGERVLKRIDSWVKGQPDTPDPASATAPQRKTSSGVSWSIQ